MSAIVVIDPDEHLSSCVGPALAEDLQRRWPTGLVPPTVESLVDSDATLVVLGPGLTPDDQIEWAEQIDLVRPDVVVVACGTTDPEFLARALRVGVRDVIAESESDQALVEAIQRASEAAQRRRQAIVIDLVEQQRPQHVITVLSPKGGSGKTTLATNLAVGLAGHLPGQVVLVDLDIQFGDVASALRLAPQHTLSDAVSLGVRLDLTTLKVLLTPHSSGLYVLCAPEALVEADEVSPEHLKPILSLLSEQFPYVVIDTPAGIRDDTVAALDLSTDFVLVCSTDVPSVKGLLRQLTAFDSIKLTDQHRVFVINRSNARVGLSVADIEATIGLPVDVMVPSSRAVVVSTNQGQPIVAGDSRDPARRAFEDLVDLFLPSEPMPTVLSGAAATPRRKRRYR